uniref:MOR2-PAG1_C domain-containing protein n=1 Tax=Echinostoma caproni TaxID=27848 RepID=A0A183B157_9TREM
LSTVQALLACASIPVPPELTTVANYHPPPTAVLPHWVITWLTYQSYRLLHAGASESIRRFVRSVLESATLPPPPPLPMPPSVQTACAMLDTVAGWYDENRVDTHFWISSCLTHLLFLGDETPKLVYQWLIEQLECILNHSTSDINSNSFTGLIHVLLRLGLATVPMPPSVPSMLEPGAPVPPGPPSNATVPGSGPVASVNTTPFMTSAMASNSAHARYPLGPANYSGFPLLLPPHPSSDPFGPGPTGGPMQSAPGGAMPPYYPQSMRRPNTGTAPFPPRAMFGAGQPPGRSPHNMHVGPSLGIYPNTPQSNNSLSSSSNRPRRHGIRLEQNQPSSPPTGAVTSTEWTVCTPTRQPASLVWLLNLAKLLRVASVTALAHALPSLTRGGPSDRVNVDRVLACAIDPRQLSTESPILVHLATEMLLTAPGSSPLSMRVFHQLKIEPVHVHLLHR